MRNENLSFSTFNVGKNESMLLSFEHDWFLKLEAGTTKFEYRKNLPLGPIKVYFYVSKPIKAITGFALFGQRENLIEWLEKYSDRPPKVTARIVEYLKDCRYVVPVLTFQKTNRITLEELRNNVPDFIVPRMYYFIKKDSLLEKYLEKHLHPEGDVKINNFEIISDDEICI